MTTQDQQVWRGKAGQRSPVTAVLVVLLGATLLGSAVFVRALSGATFTIRPSRVQVLANDQEMWVFLQVTVQRRSSIFFASPPVMGFLERRLVFRWKSDQWQVLSDKYEERHSEVTWQSRIGRILRLENSFVIFEYPHMNPTFR